MSWLAAGSPTNARLPLQVVQAPALEAVRFVLMTHLPNYWCCMFSWMRCVSLPVRPTWPGAARLNSLAARAHSATRVLLRAEIHALAEWRKEGLSHSLRRVSPQSLEFQSRSEWDCFRTARTVALRSRLIFLLCVVRPEIPSCGI